MCIYKYIFNIDQIFNPKLEYCNLNNTNLTTLAPVHINTQNQDVYINTHARSLPSQPYKG